MRGTPRGFLAIVAVFIGVYILVFVLWAMAAVALGIPEGWGRGISLVIAGVVAWRVLQRQARQP
jgi:hypothetical protein